MTKFLLSLHVLAAVLAVGPVAVAASMFPASLRSALGPPGEADAPPALRTLHRICRVYAAVGVAVPLTGFATASSLGVLGSAWLIASIVLTTAAAAVLMLWILPAQEAALAAVEEPGSGPPPRPAAQLSMSAGVFNLLWATVTVLMIVRPGSTTGA
ncbi:hypothetical protein [Streptomyces longispororuber]|uniref:hypothetical protein n=1 Tax=Streptomyces longispororuber TaxID=68230 RepID=UPI002109FF33|nr:hypothetical protein [Streptomyces longispororuber]MCQ4214033.1 hypothetical protein [Streptomyces longispororuber]